MFTLCLLSGDLGSQPLYPPQLVPLIRRQLFDLLPDPLRDCLLVLLEGGPRQRRVEEDEAGVGGHHGQRQGHRGPGHAGFHQKPGVHGVH